MKRGPLSVAEKMAIDALSENGLNTQEIGSTINRTPTVVEEYIAAKPIKQEVVVAPSPPPPPPQPRLPNAFCHATAMNEAKKEDNRVTVMTKAASEQYDELRKIMPSERKMMEKKPYISKARK